MNTEVYVLNCPSCGGKISYQKDKNVWECSYCHKSFQTVFAKEEQLPVKDREEKTIYFHHCSNCGKDYTVFKEKEATCIYCNKQKNDAYKSISATAFLKPTMDIQNIKIYYDKPELNKCPREYLEEYLKDEWYFEYVSCDMINGILELRYNHKTKKYIFVNLLVPNLDYEDYRFMYELGNSGLRQKTKESDFGITLLETALKYQKNIKVKTTNHFDNIINTCIDTFQKENHIQDRNSIEIINNIKLRTGYYIPIYYKICNINNTNYYQHILANRDFSKTTFIQYPKIENSLTKYKICDAISKISLGIFLLSLAFLFGYGALQNIESYPIDSLYNLFMIVLFSLPISALTALIFYKKVDYYYDSTVITKEKYYDQIVNNSNYVKVIGGRR